MERVEKVEERGAGGGEQTSDVVRVTVFIFQITVSQLQFISVP